MLNIGSAFRVQRFRVEGFGGVREFSWMLFLSLHSAIGFYPNQGRAKDTGSTVNL
jgi:hypothetical protein